MDKTRNISRLNKEVESIDKEIEKKLSEILDLQEKKDVFQFCLNIVKSDGEKTKKKKRKREPNICKYKSKPKNDKQLKEEIEKKKCKRELNICKESKPKNDKQLKEEVEKTKEEVEKTKEDELNKISEKVFRYCNGYHKYGPERYGVKICLNCSAELIVQ